MNHTRVAPWCTVWVICLTALTGSTWALGVEPGAGAEVLGEAAAGSSASRLARASSTYRFKSGERCFMRKINRRRARRGLRRLRRDRQLGYVARRHARRMARRGRIWHNDVGSKVTRWRRIGQNVGMGSQCRYFFKRFWRSTPHRANILGRWRYMGVGTKWSHGRLFVQHVFESRRNPGNVYHYP